MLLTLLWSVTATVLSGANIDFARDVAPILRQHCAACHAGKVKSSGFTVDSMESVIQGGNKHGKAVIGGHPEKSPLLQLIKGDIAPRMPAGLDTLAKADVDRIEAWIRALPAERAPDKQAGRWPFETPVSPAIPAVKASAWVRNPIDNFILAKLDANALAPAPEADRRTLLRRVY